MELTKTQINVLAQEVLKEIKKAHSIKSKTNEIIIEQEWNKIIKSKEYKELEKINNSGILESFSIKKQYVSKMFNNLNLYTITKYNNEYTQHEDFMDIKFKDLKTWFVNSYNYKNNIHIPSIEQIKSKVILKFITNVSDVDQLIKDIASMF